MPRDDQPITTLAELRALTPRQIERARRDGRLDVAALAADRAAEDANRHRQARIDAGLIPADPTNTDQGA